MKCDPNFVLKKYKYTEKINVRKSTNILAVLPLGDRTTGDYYLYLIFLYFPIFFLMRIYNFYKQNKTTIIF